ncbi:hypothetical protein EYF80_052901 [Liparis tanakae]|uniref:Uncharacterized protein n=1 Tax=Liparis tanakae TaxID=230148 RepID=A0A4Z2F705_9TELE|nr:hypothetical protein EYF80_052901 [Liparis tanakae]
MPLMGLSWPFSSPRVPSVSVCHSLSTPPLQPLSRAGEPGTTPSAHTQSRSLRPRSHFLMPLSREPLNRMSPCTTRDSMPS